MVMKFKKIFGIVSIGLASAILLAACSSNPSKSSSDSNNKSKTITVAISSDSNPYEYEKNGKLTGFEYDLLQKIDKALPQYDFKYTTMKDDSLLLALDGNRAQIAANNFGKTPAREEKYLFTYPEYQGVNAIFSNEKAPITSISGLFGKTTEIPTGTNYGAIMESWNSKNTGKKIKIAYSGNALADRLNEISTGKIDFLFADQKAAENLVKEHGITNVVNNLPTDLSKYPEFKTYSYFVLPESQKKLQTEMNKKIKKFAENGTLKKLSEKYFGDNQVPNLEQYK